MGFLRKTKTGRLLAAFVLLLLVSGPASAAVYTWEDAGGNTHITSEPPPKGARLLNVDGRSAGTAAAAKVKAARVELYTTSWCPYCTKAKTFFKSRGVPFVEYDIEKDPAAASRKGKLDSRRGVPFAVVNGQKIHGYDPDGYARALRSSRD